MAVSDSYERRGRLLVISHACVLPVNQHVYVHLAKLGWDLTLVVPATWRHEYSPERFAASPLAALVGRFIPTPVALAGRPQRHFYRESPAKLIERFDPGIILLEEESFSLAAAQWARAAGAAGKPYGVQAAENLDRSLPAIARTMRGRTLP